MSVAPPLRAFRCNAPIACGSLDFAYSRQTGAEHFQQCAQFALLRNRGLGPLAVTVLPIMALDLTITRTDEMSIDGHISKAVTARANILTGAVKLEL